MYDVAFSVEPSRVLSPEQINHLKLEDIATALDCAFCSSNEGRIDSQRILLMYAMNSSLYCDPAFMLS